MPDNLRIPEGEGLRVVNIQGTGAYPCGGTHIRDTDQIGKIEIRSITRHKGVSKISYNISQDGSVSTYTARGSD